jgi:hypothetical protein
MDNLWIGLGISVLVVITFIAVMRSILQQNREIDKKIDYSKVRQWQDDDDD